MRLLKMLLMAVVLSLLPVPLQAVAEEGKRDFSREPVRFMADIYKDYHNWKTDEGIAKAREAITVVDRLYAEDPQTAIRDQNLRLNRAYQVKSTLHTLLGMLYYRKSLTVAGEQKGEGVSVIAEKIRTKKEITDQDLEGLDRALKSGVFLEEMGRYLTLAREEFEAAIAVDSTNPAPHFQLAAIYGAMKTDDMTDRAEKELSLAARLSLAEGDARAADRAIETLRELNPRSVYLTQKGGKDAH